MKLCNATVVEPIVIPPDHSDQSSHKQQMTSSQQIIDVSSDQTHPLIAWFRKFLWDRIRPLFPLVLLISCLLASSVIYHYKEHLSLQPPMQHTVVTDRMGDELMAQDRKVLHICKGNTVDEKETVLGVLWDDECHVITRYSDLKGSSVFTVEKSEAVHIPLSVQALDEEMDVAILKLDKLYESSLKTILAKQERMGMKPTTAPVNIEAHDTVQDPGIVPQTDAAAAATEDTVAEKFKSINKQDIEHLIIYGRRMSESIKV